MRKKRMFLAGIVLGLAAAGTLRADLTIRANNGEDKVTQNGVGVSGVVMSGPPGNPVRDEFGQCTVEVNSGGSATVHPVRAGYAFTPATRSYYAGQTDDQGGQDYAASASSSGGGDSGIIKPGGSCPINKFFCQDDESQTRF